MTLEFRGYPKIPSQRSTPLPTLGGIWVALEKLHGAHMVIASDGDVVKIGKRKAWLEPDEAFFGWQLIQSELSEAVRSMARATGAKRTVVYGELIGGAYPHSAVPAVPGLTAVQSGIWYTPSLVWVVFDALVAMSEEDEGEMLAHHELEALSKASGLRTPPRLGRGTRSELDRLVVGAETQIPQWFGLPAIANNLAEGMVLKPDQRLTTGQRPVIKRKLPEFDDARFGEAETWNPGQVTVELMMIWAERLVQPARLASARSKVGENSELISEEAALDVAIDLESAFGDAWRRLGPDAHERVMSHTTALARHLLESD
jgi:Rnl2 family RNA ligase